MGDGNVGPCGSFKERLNCGETIVAQLQDQQATGLEETSRLGDERAEKLVAFFAAVKG